MTHDVAEIAGGAAQRLYLVALSDEVRPVFDARQDVWGPDWHAPDNFARVQEVEDRLISGGLAMFTAWRQGGNVAVLTERGLALRQHLISQEPTHVD